VLVVVLLDDVVDAPGAVEVVVVGVDELSSAVAAAMATPTPPPRSSNAAAISHTRPALIPSPSP
jgi:hypothetical protein